MSDDRTKADKAWEARQEAARYRIFNAATNAAEATDEADDETYFAVSIFTPLARRGRDAAHEDNEFWP